MENAKGVKEDTRTRSFSADASERHCVRHMALGLARDIGWGLKEEVIDLRHDGWVQHASNPEIDKYYKDVTFWGGREGTRVYNPSNGVPWCAAFVNWCLEQAGIDGNASASAKSFQDYGVRQTTPLHGCIAAVRRSPGSNKHHVGFFLRRDGNRVILLGGNQSDSVSATGTYPVSGAFFRWPKGAPRHPMQDDPSSGCMFA